MIYQEILLNHYKYPLNSEPITNPTTTIKKYNSLCGDQIELQIKVKDQIIQDLSYEIKGCAILVASASILYKEIKGLKVSTALTLVNNLNIFFNEQQEIDLKSRDLLALSEITEYPARKQCVLLPWNALKEGILSISKQKH